MWLNKHGKKFLLIIALSFLWPQLVWANGDFGSKIPELNPLCWRRSECLLVETRQFIEMTSGHCKTIKGVKDGEQWGMCLPVGTVTTNIGIGGVTTFTHIGDYILTVYNYAVKVAGIIAVAVIIVAGLQWLTSGGNSDMISRAQKRIFGAIIGLIIAYASYFILNNINPALVYLRLPNVWAIKPVDTIPDMCSQLAEDKVLFQAAEYTDQSSPVTKPLSTTKYTYKAAKEKFKNDAKYKASGYLEWFPCGRRFIVEGGGNSTCFADTCQTEGTVCGPFGSDAKKKYFCQKGNITIKVTHTGGKWEMDKIVEPGFTRLLALCQGKGANGGYVGEWSIAENKDAYKSYNGKQVFVLMADDARLENVIKSCDKLGGLAGYVIKLAMNKDTAILKTVQSHYIGKDSKDLGSGLVKVVNVVVSPSMPDPSMPDPSMPDLSINWDQDFNSSSFFGSDFIGKGKTAVITVDANNISYDEDWSKAKQTVYKQYLK